MTTAGERHIRIDVQEVTHASGRQGFAWAVQATAPVETLFISPGSFETRSFAIDDFERVAKILGWRTYVGVDGATVIEEDEARADRT